jgi:hypothetical protein
MSITIWEHAIGLPVPTVHITATKDDVAAIKELVQRGCNLWPDAPPAIKELADKLTHGRVLQDYYQQANIPRPPL